MSSRTKQQLMRVWNICAAIEGKPDSAGTSGNGDNAARRALCGAVTNDKKVVIVINQFIRGGQAVAKDFAYGANQRLLIGIKFSNESFELFYSASLLGCVSNLFVPVFFIPDFWIFDFFVFGFMVFGFSRPLQLNLIAPQDSDPGDFSPACVLEPGAPLFILAAQPRYCASLGSLCLPY